MRFVASVKHIRTFEDASGAPAVVSYGPYTFAVDTLGDVRLTLISPVYGSRVESKIAASAARRAYLAERDTLVSGTWLAANRTMYQS
jgi:hypothetical protein